jgi:hypothetical protein
VVRVAADADVRKNGNASTLLNGHSLAHLTDAAVSSRIVTEVRLPASRMAEVLDRIHALGDTGSLQVNFHKGRALDLKWTGTRNTK